MRKSPTLRAKQPIRIPLLWVRMNISSLTKRKTEFLTISVSSILLSLGVPISAFLDISISLDTYVEKGSMKIERKIFYAISMIPIIGTPVC